MTDYNSYNIQHFSGQQTSYYHIADTDVLHRIGGPAYIDNNNSCWYRNGVRFRENGGPDSEWFNGYQEYHDGSERVIKIVSGVGLCDENRLIFSNINSFGTEILDIHGYDDTVGVVVVKIGTDILHNIDGPAVYYKDGSRTEWYSNGILHRDGGPAIEFYCGTGLYYSCGKLHRTDGPAVSYLNGTDMWYYHGMLHRENGPAVYYNHAGILIEDYYLFDVYYHTKEEYENALLTYYKNG